MPVPIDVRGRREQRRPRLIAEFSIGQSTLELAIVAPFLVIIIVVVGQFMRIYYMTIELNNAARAGVQYGVQSPTAAADISGMEQAALNDGSDIPGLSATASEYCECPGDSPVACGSSTICSDERIYVEVDTSATFYTHANWPGIPQSVPLSGKAVMRVQ